MNKMRIIDEIKAMIAEEVKNSWKNKKLVFSVSITMLLVMIISFSQIINILFIVLIEGSVGSFMSIPYTVMFYLLPFILLLISYDLINKEIYEKTIRNTITKIGRLSFVMGKFLSHLMIIMIDIILIFFVIMIYVYVKSKVFIVHDTIVSIIYLFCLVFFFLALYGSISTIFNKPSTSLYISILILIMFLIFKGNENIGFLSPFRYFEKTISFGAIALESLIFLLIGTALLAGTIIMFRRKDL